MNPFLRLSLALLFLAGCASPTINWDERVGNYTYDQAVLELGPPNKYSQLSDGTAVGEWLDPNRSRSSFSFGFGAGFGGGNGGVGIGQSVGPFHGAPFLRLTFDKDGRLLSWRKVG